MVSTTSTPNMVALSKAYEAEGSAGITLDMLKYLAQGHQGLDAVLSELLAHEVDAKRRQAKMQACKAMVTAAKALMAADKHLAMCGPHTGK
jgi:hypothetical protein